MRLWSIHPCYLDRQGLVALWREGLGALKALKAWGNGEKCGYQNHPQLDRFKIDDGIGVLVRYLWFVRDEAVLRGYKFDCMKIADYNCSLVKIPVTLGQVKYEANLLRNKILGRKQSVNTDKLKTIDLMVQLGYIDVNPIFKVIEGDVEKWEIVK